VPFLGFGVNSAPVSLAGSPNSTIKVPVGTTINITFAQTGISDPIDLSFPSLPIGSVTGGGASYTVDANTVGTMVFQPGLNPDAPKQIAQGLVGVLIVTPAGCVDPELKCGYDATTYEDEALIATTDLDLEFALDPGGFDMGYFGQSIDTDFSDRQVYHFINGKSFPDTDVIEVRADDDVLLRYVNAGVTDKAMGTLGLRQSLLGRNASAYTDPQTVISPLIGPGETADVAVKIPSTAPLGHFYSIIDSGRQMNNGTGTGFGGALTFLNVRDGTVVPIAPLAVEETPTGDTTPAEQGIAGAGDAPGNAPTGDTTPPTGDTTPPAGAGDTPTGIGG
jgi:FtsP/CotA-like multicopper oxidase with cupredoxin domain